MASISKYASRAYSERVVEMFKDRMANDISKFYKVNTRPSYAVLGGDPSVPGAEKYWEHFEFTKRPENQQTVREYLQNWTNSWLSGVELP